MSAFFCLLRNLDPLRDEHVSLLQNFSAKVLRAAETLRRATCSLNACRLMLRFCALDAKTYPSAVWQVRIVLESEISR